MPEQGPRTPNTTIYKANPAAGSKEWSANEILNFLKEKVGTNRVQWGHTTSTRHKSPKPAILMRIDGPLEADIDKNYDSITAFQAEFNKLNLLAYLLPSKPDADPNELLFSITPDPGDSEVKKASGIESLFVLSQILPERSFRKNPDPQVKEVWKEAGWQDSPIRVQPRR